MLHNKQCTLPLIFSFILLVAVQRRVRAAPTSSSNSHHHHNQHHRHRYPLPDIRHIVWPQAQPSASELECFTELDREFIASGRSYRLTGTGRMPNGSCLVRIPTRTRLTVSRMSITSPESYVRVIAGSSDLHMPLRTEHIRQDQPDKFGPWHVPCRRAYLVFRSKGQGLEWVEFSLGPETEDDRKDSERQDCAEDGCNYASVELIRR